MLYSVSGLEAHLANSHVTAQVTYTHGMQRSKTRHGLQDRSLTHLQISHVFGNVGRRVGGVEGRQAARGDIHAATPTAVAKSSREMLNMSQVMTSACMPS